MTVRLVDILGQLAHSTTTVGILSGEILRAIMFLTVYAIRTGEFLTPGSEQIPQSPEELRLCHWRIWLNCMRFPMASLEGIGRCRILRWASLGNFSLVFPRPPLIVLVFPRPPLIVRCFLWLKKEKMKLQKQKYSRFMFHKWIPSLQGHTNFFTFKVFRKSSEIQSLQSKTFIFRGRLCL